MAEAWDSEAGGPRPAGTRGGASAPAGGRRAPSPGPGSVRRIDGAGAVAAGEDEDEDEGGWDTEEAGREVGDPGEEYTPAAVRPRHRSGTRDRIEKIGLRVTSAERAQLRDAAIAEGLGLSEYLRARLLGGTSGPGPSAWGVDEGLYQELRGYQGDLHTLLHFVQHNTPGLIHTDVATLDSSLRRQSEITEQLIGSLQAWQGRDAHLDTQMGDLGDQLAAVSHKLDGLQRVGKALYSLAKADDRLDEVLRLTKGLARQQGARRAASEAGTGDE